MKTFFATLAAVAFAAEAESATTEIILVPYASGQTQPDLTQGIMKAEYKTEDENGTMVWEWKFKIQSKANLSLASNNFFCWYLGFPTTADATMHQTMAGCATYNATDNMLDFDSQTVQNFVWTYNSAEPTKSQMGASGTTYYLGGQATKQDAPWMAYKDPTFMSMTNDSNQTYYTYAATAKREFGDSTGNLELAANGKYNAYGSYYTWKSSAVNQAIKDGKSGTMVEVSVLEVASASQLATAAAVAVVATLAF